MIPKDTLNRMTLKDIQLLDLNILENTVKEFIKKYYGSKKLIRKLVKTDSGFSSFEWCKPTKTLHNVFIEFKQLNKDSFNYSKKIFKYLNQNYNSKQKLRDLFIFRLRNEEYSFKEIAEITGLSLIRVKQVYYEIRKIINDNFK